MDDEITSRSFAVRHTFDYSLHQKKQLFEGGGEEKGNTTIVEERRRERWRNSVEERGRGRRGSKSFCGFATQADRKIRNEWRSDTQCNVRRRTGSDTSERPPSRYRQPPFAPCFIPLPPRAEPLDTEPFTSSNGKKWEGRRGRKRADKSGVEKKQVGLKRALMRGQKLGGWALPPSFFHCIGIDVVSRGGRCRKGNEWRRGGGDAWMWRIAGIRHESRGRFSRSPLFHRGPPTILALLNEKVGWSSPLLNLI